MPYLISRTKSPKTVSVNLMSRVKSQVASVSSQASHAIGTSLLGKYTAEYLMSVSRDFDAPARNDAIPPKWFYCMVGCKRLFPSKFMAGGGCWCLMCDDDMADY